MNKTKFEGFLNRYSLGGEVESVMIVVDDSTISAKMVSDDKTLLGNVVMQEDSFPNGSYGIYTTSQLKQLLSVLDNNIEVSLTDQSHLFNDEVSKIQYMRAQESVIPKVPDLKSLPDFDVEIALDDEFVNRFIKSTGALSDSDKFTFVSTNGVSEIVLGFATINTNRISIKVNATVTSDVEPISFSAKYLRQILTVNKSSGTSTTNTASLKISTKGLCVTNFSAGDYTSEYFIVAIE